MKTVQAIFAGTLLTVSLCSCGIDRTMGSFDQEIARQKMQTNTHFLAQNYTGSAAIIQAAEIAHRHREGLLQQDAEANQTQHTALRSDPEAAFIMRDNQNRIRAIGKPALATANSTRIPETDDSDAEDKQYFMK